MHRYTPSELLAAHLGRRNGNRQRAEGLAALLPGDDFAIASDCCLALGQGQPEEPLARLLAIIKTMNPKTTLTVGQIVTDLADPKNDELTWKSQINNLACR